LVSACSDESIRAWDANTGEPVGERLLGHGKQVWSVNFRTVGDRLALVSSGGDGKIIWWDWETRMPLRPPLPTGQESEWMRVSADGERILISFTNPVAWVIDADLLPWPERACAIANRNLTAAEWDYYLPDRPYQSTCPQAVE
jgi:WD40 repeat protein